MKVLLTILLAIACIAVAGATFLFVAGPSELLRDQLAQAVKQQTGRDIVINGGASFTFYPRFGVALGDVVVPEPEGMGDAPFAHVARLEILMPLRALLTRELTVDTLVLSGAVIDLRVDAQGRGNWDLPRLPMGVPGKRAQLGPTEHGPTFAPVRLASNGDRLPVIPGAGLAASDTAPALGNVQILNGTLRYASEVTGARQAITAIDLSLRQRQPVAELSLDGHGVWRGQIVQVVGTVKSLQSLLTGISPVAVKLTSESGEAQFEGMAAVGALFQLNGRLRLTAGSLRQATSWIGWPLPPGAGGPLSFVGHVAATPDLVAAKEMVASIDGLSARGEVAIAMEASRPTLRGNLVLDRLDLNARLGQVATSTSKPATAGTAAGDTGTTAGGGITDLLESMDRPTATPPPSAGQAPSAAKQVKGWSSIALDVAFLKVADADLKLDVGRLLYKDLTLDRVKVSATLRGGALTTVFHEASLYKGRGTGTLELDATHEQARLGLQATLEGVEMQPLLKSVAGFDRLAGRGTVAVRVAGQGLNQQQITESLAGTATATIASGAFVGFDAMGLVRAAQKGQAPPAGSSHSDKTDFSELSATFAIVNGVAQSQDMKVLSAIFKISGSGSIDLGKQMLDLQLRPRLTAAAPAGQTGAQGQIVQALSGLDIPVHVRGPWDAPRASVDVNAVAKDPDKIKKGVEHLGEILKSKEGKEAAKELGNAVRNLLGR